jgi:hypothetical protein
MKFSPKKFNNPLVLTNKAIFTGPNGENTEVMKKDLTEFSQGTILALKPVRSGTTSVPFPVCIQRTTGRIFPGT